MNILMDDGKDRTLSAAKLVASSLSSLSVDDWSKSCTNTEVTFHQISPYIGKLKSSIAQDLILSYSKPGDLIADVFSGSGTVLLEAVRHGRKAFGIDNNPYAAVLSRAKLSAPATLDVALSQANQRLEASRARLCDTENVPDWVKAFFHPQTLAEIVRFVEECKEHNDEFMLACLMGILHHQRPGFLSYPSSHLTPYLRNNKFPKEKYPQLYEYRPLEPRLLAKIKRTYKRKDFISNPEQFSFTQGRVEDVQFPNKVDCFITSPPYMNALNYGRDNRLRLWFCNQQDAKEIDKTQPHQKQRFKDLMITFASKVSESLVERGYCILIIGDKSTKVKGRPLSEEVCDVFQHHAPSLHLVDVVDNEIPDIRRARRDCQGVRNEKFLVFEKR